MASDAHVSVRSDLHCLFDHGIPAHLTDSQLLDRFLSRNGESSETAFSALVERHGPMVVRVCSRILHDPHDVDDAVQATFLILIRKAAAIRKRGSCASWLHGVALRAAAGIRTSAARRREHERKRAATTGDLGLHTAAEPQDDLPRLIHEELGRLREQHRAPVVLCYLEGRTCEEAARTLGWPVGTVKTRLARARERLRRRLAGSGMAPSVILAAGVDLGLEREAISTAARFLEQSIRCRSIGLTATETPPRIAALVRAELMRGHVARAVSAGLILAAIGVALASAVSRNDSAADEPAPAVAQPEPPKTKLGPIHATVVDLQGKPVAGAEVTVFQLAGPVKKLRTDQNGHVVVNEPRADDWFSLLASRGDALGGRTHYPPIPLEAGTPEKPLVLTLTPRTHKVSGTIIDMQGRPIAGVRVAAQTLHFEEHNLSLSRRTLEKDGYPLGSSVTDTEGRYTLLLPAHRDMSLGAYHPRYVSPWLVIPEDLDVVEPITLQTAGAITGRVIDAATGAPLAGADLGAQRLDSLGQTNGEGGEATSNADGKFVMEGLAPGVYNVTLSAVRGRPHATARAVTGVRVRARADASAELQVIEGIPVQGVVVDSTTLRPISNAMVLCHGPAHPLPGRSVDIRRSDEDGRFTFYVPPGENVLYYRHPDMAARGSRLSGAHISVTDVGKVPPIRLVGPFPERSPSRPPGMMQMQGTITSGRRAKTVFRNPKPPEGRTVIGQVLDEAGQPIVGVSVGCRLITKNSMNTVSTAVTDRQGIFIASGLPREELTLVATRPGDDGREGMLSKVVPGDTNQVEFTFGPRVKTRRFSDPEPPFDEPIPPELKHRLTFVNLDPKGTEFLADGPGGGGDDLNRFSQGAHKLGNTFYRIGERLIHLSAQATPDLPDKVTSIPVDARGNRVRILHSARGEVPIGTEIGFYTVHYGDGKSERIPIVYGQDVGNWWSSRRQPPATPSRAPIAWTGTNQMGDRSPPELIKIHLFGASWVNPNPQRVIKSIDAVSTSRDCELVVVAVTLERD